MLKLSFYESGNGETIIITFPNGGIGIVDAHPSKSGTRPDILKLTENKKIHFVCLTHPHKDHGLDIVKILENHPDIGVFWHTVSDVLVLAFSSQESPNYPNYPSDCRNEITNIRKGWAEFLIDLFGAVIEKNIPYSQVRSEVKPKNIDGVDIHFLSPDESINQKYIATYRRSFMDAKIHVPNANLLSGILALKYGKVCILLGGDAISENWRKASRLFFELKLPKAQIIKIPHHGAKDALEINPPVHEHNYLEICNSNPKAKSILFAGDSKHPNPKVFGKIINRTEITCLSNGLKANNHNTNPLNIMISGAHAVTSARICNPDITYTIDDMGIINQLTGRCDNTCNAFSRTE